VLHMPVCNILESIIDLYLFLDTAPRRHLHRRHWHWYHWMALQHHPRLVFWPLVSNLVTQLLKRSYNIPQRGFTGIVWQRCASGNLTPLSRCF
jgi:hypothetical protein